MCCFKTRFMSKNRNETGENVVDVVVFVDGGDDEESIFMYQMPIYWQISSSSSNQVKIKNNCCYNKMWKEYEADVLVATDVDTVLIKWKDIIYELNKKNYILFPILKSKIKSIFKYKIKETIITIITVLTNVCFIEKSFFFEFKVKTYRPQKVLLLLL